MEQSTRWDVVKRLWIAPCAILTMGLPAVADESGAKRDAYEQACGTDEQ